MIKQISREPERHSSNDTRRDKKQGVLQGYQLHRGIPCEHLDNAKRYFQASISKNDEDVQLPTLITTHSHPLYRQPLQLPQWRTLFVVPCLQF